jgi:spore germination cell wall hydrolase CwlJ-like protein
VAAVVMNRVAAARHPRGPRHWGTDVVSACRAPFQFGCWNPNSPTHRRALEQAGPALEAARRIAARALRACGPAPVGGATHYHAADTLPAWAIGRVPVAETGGLVFYRLEM